VQGTDSPLIDTSVAGISEAALWRAYNVTISKKSNKRAISPITNHG